MLKPLSVMTNTITLCQFQFIDKAQAATIRPLL
jgi:hypothetical protein